MIISRIQRASENIGSTPKYLLGGSKDTKNENDSNGILIHFGTN
jgi:hypothetical protein